MHVVLCLDECTVELDGPIEVNGNSATYSFHGVGSGIEGFICKLNGVAFDCMLYTHCNNIYILIVL